MNRTALGTILGAALLGLAKSKGSPARRSAFDEIFKRKVGNQDQIFKIYFSMNYAPFWIDRGYSSAVQYDFEEYVGRFLDTVHDVSEGTDTEDEDFFADWCYDNDMYWSDDLASDLMVLDEWRHLENLRSNSKFNLKFTESIDADDIQQNIINGRVGELEQLIDDGDVFDYGRNDYLVGGFLETLIEEGSFEGIEWEDEDEFNALQDQIIEKKEELKEFLNERKNEIFGTEGDWLFDWEDEVQAESGYVTGVLDVKLNLQTMNISKNQWQIFIETVLHNAYYEWYREEKPRNTIGDAEVSYAEIFKVQPDIFPIISAKQKSNLRKK